MNRIHRVLVRAIVATAVLGAALQAAGTIAAPPHGLHAEYFAGERAEGEPEIAAVDDRIATAAIQRRWLTGAPGVFTARWFGFLTIDRPGRYTFSLTSDDGAVLSIDGAAVVDNGGLHGLQTQQGTVSLGVGQHAVLMQFTQSGGDYALEWRWARDDGPLTQVPEWRLTPQRGAAMRLRLSHAAQLGAMFLGIAAVLLAVALAWRSRSWFVAHPSTSTLVLFTLFAVVHTWPLATDLVHLTRHDNRDAILNEWIVAWVAHQLPRAPLHLFDANIFYPEPRTLAYSEAMVVQGVLAMPLLWLGAPIVLVYNLLIIAGMTLTGWTTAFVVRKWTGDWTAAIVAGSLFAFNAHSLSRIPHLQTQHLEFLPLMVFALDRVVAQPRATSAFGLAVSFVLNGLTSVYLLTLGLFAMMAAAIVRLPELLRPRPRAVIPWLLAAGAVAGAVLTPFLLPYWSVSRDLGRVRSLGEAGNYAATWSAYLATPARVHAWWSARFAEGNILFPGALALLLAGVAIARGVAFRDRRARMCLAAALTGVALSFGTGMPGYALLYQATPLLGAVRATARFGLLASFGVAMLAGFGVVVVRTFVGPGVWKPVAGGLVLVAGLESWSAPLGLVRFERIAPIYEGLNGPGVVVEMPFFDQRSAQFHAHYMLNSTEHWLPIVNGYSGFQPPSFVENAAALGTFPAEPAFARMHALGVTYLFVHTAQLPAGTAQMVDGRPDVERIRVEGTTILYRLRR
jgi:hypothetical protein